MGGSNRGRKSETDVHLGGRTDRLKEKMMWQELYTGFWPEYQGGCNKTHFPICRGVWKAIFWLRRQTRDLTSSGKGHGAWPSYLPLPSPTPTHSVLQTRQISQSPSLPPTPHLEDAYSASLETPACHFIPSADVAFPEPSLTALFPP